MTGDGLSDTCESSGKKQNILLCRGRVCVTTETVCKATQRKQVKTDGDRTLQLTSIDLLFKREGARVGEGAAGRG